MTNPVETITLTVDVPEAGWSAIRFGDEAVIPLSYIQNIPAKVLLLQLLDGMLAETRGWAIWQSMYDDEPVDDGARLDAWNRYIAKKTEELGRALQTVRDELKEA